MDIRKTIRKQLNTFESMLDKYQDIKDREYAKLALLHAELDRKHKRVIRRIIIFSVLFGLLLTSVCFF